MQVVGLDGNWTAAGVVEGKGDCGGGDCWVVVPMVDVVVVAGGGVW